MYTVEIISGHGMVSGDNTIRMVGDTNRIEIQGQSMVAVIDSARAVGEFIIKTVQRKVWAPTVTIKFGVIVIIRPVFLMEDGNKHEWISWAGNPFVESIIPVKPTVSSDFSKKIGTGYYATTQCYVDGQPHIPDYFPSNGGYCHDEFQGLPIQGCR